jgi:LacI family transcriptional regulator
MHKSPTIIDVASLAGVSKSTVSNVLQDKTNVNAEMRSRVLLAMERLGYRLHAGARFMRQPSKVIGVIVGDLTNAFHAELAAEVEKQSAAKGYSILLASTGGIPEHDVTRVRTLLEHRVAALMFLSEPSKAALSLVEKSVPTVFLSGAGNHASSITVDSTAGTRLAVEHLVGLGHREIGFVSMMLADEPKLETKRYQGYVDGMAHAGLSIRRSYLLREHGKRRSLQQTYRDLLRSYLDRPDRPTAVVAALDRLALEIMSVADDLSIRIPQDLSLVGFDDIPISRHSRIALTTILQPMSKLAGQAVDLVVDSVLKPEPARTEVILIQPELIVRQSTSSPARAL